MRVEKRKYLGSFKEKRRLTLKTDNSRHPDEYKGGRIQCGVRLAPPPAKILVVVPTGGLTRRTRFSCEELLHKSYWILSDVYLVYADNVYYPMCLSIRVQYILNTSFVSDVTCFYSRPYSQNSNFFKIVVIDLYVSQGFWTIFYNAKTLKIIQIVQIYNRYFYKLFTQNNVKVLPTFCISNDEKYKITIFFL